MGLLATVLFVSIAVAGAQQQPSDGFNWRRPELPAGVRVIKDITYAKAPEQQLKLDLYLPAARPEKPLPLIVWIHGGAWRAGSKEANPAARFVDDGYASASISYRLSPNSRLQSRNPLAARTRRKLRHRSGTHRGVGLIRGRAPSRDAGHKWRCRRVGR